jgi:uncharacterized membrane protein
MGTAIVEGLHMLFTILWLGGTVWANFVVGPASVRTSPAAAGEFGAQIGIQASRVIPPVARMAILLGVLRGTVWGPINSLKAVFNTGHRRCWFIALLFAIVTFVRGQRLTGPSAASIGKTTDEAERLARIQRTRRLAWIELLGFLGIFRMMILMRFYPYPSSARRSLDKPRAITAAHGECRTAAFAAPSLRRRRIRRTRLPPDHWHGRDRHHLPIVAADELPPAFMHQPVMPMADEHQVVQVSRTTVRPMHEVVGRAPRRWTIATRPCTPAVTSMQGATRRPTR